MNIRAFVRGSNAVVVNKKSHGCTLLLLLIIIPIHERSILSRGTVQSPCVCTRVFVYFCICVPCAVSSFSLVRRVSAIANRKKGIKKNKRNGTGKTTRCIPSCTVVVPCSSFQRFREKDVNTVSGLRRTTLIPEGRRKVSL